MFRKCGAGICGWAITLFRAGMDVPLALPTSGGAQDEPITPFPQQRTMEVDDDDDLIMMKVSKHANTHV